MKCLVLTVSLTFCSIATAADDFTLTTVRDFLSNTCPKSPVIFIKDLGKRGMFYEEQAGTTSNGGTTLHCGSGRVYKRVYSGPVDAKWFGLAEENTGVQNSAVMATALGSLRGGEELLIPAGRYTFASPISLPTSRPIRFTAVGTLIFPDSDGVIVRAARNILDITKIEGTTGENRPDNGYSAITLLDSHHNDLRLGAASSFNYGIKLEGKVQYNKINFSRLDMNVGIKLVAEAQEDWVNENTFYGGAIYANVGIEAKRPTGSSYAAFNGNKFYNMGFEDTQVAMDVANFQRNLIIGPRFEKYDYGHVSFGASSQMNTLLVGAMYEHHLEANGVRGNAGPLTTIFGTLMTSHADQSGAIGIADASGKVLGVLSKNGNSAPSTTVINMLPLSTIPTVIQSTP